jgi:hypothetical protein
MSLPIVAPPGARLERHFLPLGHKPRGWTRDLRRLAGRLLGRSGPTRSLCGAEEPVPKEEGPPGMPTWTAGLTVRSPFRPAAS